MSGRINDHPILGKRQKKQEITIIYNDKKLEVEKGQMIAAALYAQGIRINRYTIKENKPRGIFCGIGQCTDCAMIVNGNPNTRTCITPVEEGMVIETQYGSGKRRDDNE